MTFTFTLPTPSVTLTKRRPSWWDRLRKYPVLDWIIKFSALSGLAERGFEWVSPFLRVRTASDAHGKVKPCSVNAWNVWTR